MKGLQVTENVIAVSEKRCDEEFSITLYDKNVEFCSIDFYHDKKIINVIMEQKALENVNLVMLVAYYCSVHKSFIRQQLTTTNLFGYVVSTIVQ